MKTGFPSNVLDYKEEKNSGKEQVIEIVNNVTVLCHNIRLWEYNFRQYFNAAQICLHFVGPFPGFWEGTDKTVSTGSMALLAGQECG